MKPKRHHRHRHHHYRRRHQSIIDQHYQKIQEDRLFHQQQLQGQRVEEQIASQYGQKIDGVENKTQELEVELMSLKSEEKALERQIARALQEMDRLQRKREQSLEVRQRRPRPDDDDGSEDKPVWSDTLERLEAEIQALDRKQQKYKNQSQVRLDILRKDAEHLGETIMTRQNYLDLLGEKSNDKTREVGEANDNIRTAKDENTRLANENNVLKQDLAKKTDSCKKLADQIKKKDEEIEQTKTTIIDTKENIADAKRLAAEATNRRAGRSEEVAPPPESLEEPPPSPPPPPETNNE